jgi:hypothetical protein
MKPPKGFLIDCFGVEAARDESSAGFSQSSLPGLTRQSISFERVLRREMDARVKPAHDAEQAGHPRSSRGQTPA